MGTADTVYTPTAFVLVWIVSVILGWTRKHENTLYCFIDSFGLPGSLVRAFMLQRQMIFYDAGEKLMDTFLSQLRSLLRDQAFLLSAGFSVAATIIFMITAVYLLSLDKINITKIADVSDDIELNQGMLENKPISGMFQLAKSDLSNPHAQREIFKSKWKGYLTSLSTFCNFDYINDQKVGVWVGGRFTPRPMLLKVDTIADVIVTTKADKKTAGVIKFGQNTCEIAKKLDENEHIYVVSDKQFGENEEPPTYFSIVKIDK
jgi:hypothetical protein